MSSNDASTKLNRVLFIGPYPPPYSGPEMGMKLFLESSLQEKYSISFLCTNVRKSNKNKGRFGLAMVFAFARFFSILLWKLVTVRPKVVYYPITATQIGWVGRDAPCLMLCRLFGAKTIIHLRASHFRLNYQQFRPLLQKLVRFALGLVNTVIVQSDQLHSQFQGLVAPERIKTLYQAIESDEYDNVDVLNYVRGKILFVGHQTQAKGFCDLVRAIEPVVAKVPEADFYFAGTMRRGERNVFYNQITGEKLNYEDPFDVQQEILDSDTASHYHNLGIVHGEEKLETLRSIDLFVLPSYSEGFSRAVVEAMCMGKPVVYTPVGAHQEALSEEQGARVMPGDHDALVNAITQLLTDRDRRDAIAKRNYRFVRENFDIEVIASQLSLIHI